MSTYDRTMRFREKAPCWTKWNKMLQQGRVAPELAELSLFSNYIHELKIMEVLKCARPGYKLSIKKTKWRLINRRRQVQPGNIAVFLECKFTPLSGLPPGSQNHLDYDIDDEDDNDDEDEDDDDLEELDDDDDNADARSAHSADSRGSGASSMSAGTPRMSIGQMGAERGHARLPLPHYARIPTPLCDGIPHVAGTAEANGRHVPALPGDLAATLYGKESVAQVAEAMRLPTMRELEARCAETAQRYFEQCDVELAKLRAAAYANVDSDAALARARAVFRFGPSVAPIPPPATKLDE